MTTKEELIKLMQGKVGTLVLFSDVADSILSKYICIKKADCEVTEMKHLEYGCSISHVTSHCKTVCSNCKISRVIVVTDK